MACASAAIRTINRKIAPHYTVTTVGELFTPEALAVTRILFTALEKDVPDVVVFNTGYLASPPAQSKKLMLARLCARGVKCHIVQETALIVEPNIPGGQAPTDARNAMKLVIFSPTALTNTSTSFSVSCYCSS